MESLQQMQNSDNIALQWLSVDSQSSSSNFHLSTDNSRPPKRRRPHLSATSSVTGTPPRTRSWKAYWTRSSKRSHIPNSPIASKRRKMEPTESDDTTTWPAQFENIFVQLLVELANNGRIVNGSVNNTMWTPIASRLSEMTGRTYTAAQCRTKLIRLKMNHREFSDLLHNRTGLGWDPVSNTVQGTETQWQQYLRINRKAGRFRKKGCPNYELLGILFNGSTATGALRHSSARTPPDSEGEDELNDALLRFGMHVSVGGSLGDAGGTGGACENGGGGPWGSVGGSQSRPHRGVVIGGSQSGKRRVEESEPSSDSKKKGKGKKKESSSMDSLRSDALKEFTEVHRLRKEQMLQNQQRLSSGEGSHGGAGSAASYTNSMGRALNLLDEIAPELDDQTYLRAFELLKDETTRNGFIAMGPSRRKAWLTTL